LFLAIKFNDKIKIPEKLKLMTIKAIKSAVNESNKLEENTQTLFNNTKLSYNLKYELANIIWHYNLLLREICENECILQFNIHSKEYIIDESTYNEVFSFFISLYEFVFLTDSLVSEASIKANLILDLDSPLVIRRDL